MASKSVSLTTFGITVPLETAPSVSTALRYVKAARGSLNEHASELDTYDLASAEASELLERAQYWLEEILWTTASPMERGEGEDE